MLAGPLDRRVTLLRSTLTKNDFNEDVPDWAPYATVWASKRDVSDAERARAAQDGATITTRFQIRWSPTVAEVSPSQQAECGGVRYEIGAVKELGRRDGLEISATAQVALRPADDDA